MTCLIKLTRCKTPSDKVGHNMLTYEQVIDRDYYAYSIVMSKVQLIRNTDGNPRGKQENPWSNPFVIYTLSGVHIKKAKLK